MKDRIYFDFSTEHQIKRFLAQNLKSLDNPRADRIEIGIACHLDRIISVAANTIRQKHQCSVILSGYGKNFAM